LLGATENFAVVMSGEGLPLAYLLVVLAVYRGLGSLVGVAIGIGCQRIERKNDIPFQEAFVWLTTGLTLVWAADKSIAAATFRALRFWVGPLVLVSGLAIAALAVRRLSSRVLATIDCDASLAIAVGAVIGWLAVGRFVAVQFFGSFGSVPGLLWTPSRLQLEPSASFDVTETPESLDMVSVKFRRGREMGVRPLAVALNRLRRVSTDEVLLKGVPDHSSLNFGTDWKSEQVTEGRKDVVDMGRWDLVSPSYPRAANY
jgi:hypothetical protein